MTNGTKITVNTYDHKIIHCRLVEIREETAVICSEKEWLLAARQRREPECIGWPLADVKDEAGTNGVPEHGPDNSN